MNLTSLLLGDANSPAPRITYYDDATGERIELSTVTLANWAAKTANLLRDEFGAGPGSTVAVRLPAHWQTAGVLLGIWWAGAEVVLGAGSTDVAFCTVGDEPDADEVCVLSLDAFGRPVPDLPLGVTDYSTAVRVHGDRFSPAGAGPALDGRNVDEVAAAARKSAVTQGITAQDRVLSSGAWDTPETLTAHLLAVLVVGASLVQVAHPDHAAQERRAASEKVTRTLP
jgi:uncharacterized protein (TIGR03089 family)